MNKPKHSHKFALVPTDNRRLADLCGQYDENLRRIESHLGVEINNRANTFEIIGNDDSVRKASEIIHQLFQETEAKNIATSERLHLLLQQIENRTANSSKDQPRQNTVIHTHKIQIKPRSPNQSLYVKNILNYDINFSIGPAGTGKTYLAVACAVVSLEQDQVERIIITRPAIEAGERLGFLPGDLAEKVDPYLRPIYDALFEMLGIEKVSKLIEKNIIEVAPLAYMRGRTLNDSFIILDEAQNTTKEQMKMFLTRIGFGSKAVITGDITQIDLAKGIQSGLRHAIELLKDVHNIQFSFFQAQDVVRHPLVQQIVQAYEKEKK